MKVLSFGHSVSLGVGLLTLYFHIPGSHSLKEKRSAIKPILSKVQNEFKVSAAEVGYQEAWQECMLAFSVVSSDPVHCERVLQIVYQYVLEHYPHIVISNHHIEIV